MKVFWQFQHETLPTTTELLAADNLRVVEALLAAPGLALARTHRGGRASKRRVREIEWRLDPEGVLQDCGANQAYLLTLPQRPYPWRILPRDAYNLYRWFGYGEAYELAHQDFEGSDYRD